MYIFQLLQLLYISGNCKIVIFHFVNVDVPAFIPRPFCETDKSRQHSISLDTDGFITTFYQGVIIATVDVPAFLPIKYYQVGSIFGNH